MTGTGFQFVVREGIAADNPACLALDHSVTSEYVWQVDSHETQGDVSYHFRAVRLPRAISVIPPHNLDAMNAARNEESCLLVAEGDKGLYGYLHMRLDRLCRIAWIHQLVVDRPVRRRHIGSALLIEAEKLARQRQMQRLMVEVQTKNYPGILFCQRHGLVFCGFNDRYYPNQDIAVFFARGIRPV